MASEVMQEDIFLPGSLRIREDLLREARESGFDGETFEAARDGVRLTGQLARVWDLMADGAWRTLEEIADRAGGSEGGVAARLRDLRKPRFGGFRVDRERAGSLRGFATSGNRALAASGWIGSGWQAPGSIDTGWPDNAGQEDFPAAGG